MFRPDKIQAVNTLLTGLLDLSDKNQKENVHADIFEEFSFLLAETVPPKVLNPAAFAEFDQLCGQILTEYTASSRYRHRIIGSLCY